MGRRADVRPGQVMPSAMSGADRASAMEQWEYKVLSISADTNWLTAVGLRKAEFLDEEIQKQLNSLGDAGWECISAEPSRWNSDIDWYQVTGYHALFKRRKS